MIVYNVESAIVDLVFIKGDGIDMTFTVSLNGVAYDMDGMDLKMQVRHPNGRLIKELNNAGSPAEISAIGNILTLYADGFDVDGLYYYDIQATGTKIKTIMRGKCIINKEQTT